MDMLKWQNVIVEWINCLQLLRPVRVIDELKNGEFFSKLLSTLDQSEEEKTCSSICDTYFIDFIKKSYPAYFLETEPTILQDTVEVTYLSSLLLHYCYIVDCREEFRNPLCTNLSVPSQVCIKAFLEKLQPHTEITRDILNDAINSIQKITSTPTKPHVTPCSSPKGLRTHNSPLRDFFNTTPKKFQLNYELHKKELRSLQTQLDLERFEKADLQEELKIQYEKIKKLDKTVALKQSEVSKLRSELLSLESRTPPSHKAAGSLENKRLREEIASLEKYVEILHKEQEDLQIERNKARDKLSKMEEQSTEWQCKALHAERHNSKLTLENQQQSQELLSLRERCEELSAILQELKPKEVYDESYEVDGSQVDVSHNKTGSIDCESLAHTVVDVQLFDAREENSNLRKQLLELEVNSSELTSQVNQLQSRITTIADENKSLRDDNNNLNEKVLLLVETQKELEDTNKNLTECKKSLETMSAAKHNLDKIVEDLNIKLSNTEASLTNANKENKQLVNELKTSVEQTTRLTEELKSLNLKFSNLEAERNTIQIKLNEHITTLIAYEADNTSLQQTLSKFNTDLQNSLIKFSNQINASAKLEISGIDKLESLISDLEIKNIKDTKTLSDLRENCDSLSSQVVTLHETITDLKNKEVTMSSKLAKLEKENEKYISKTESYRSKLNVAQKSLLKTETSLEELIKKHSREIENHQEQIKQMQSTNTNLEDNIKELKYRENEMTTELLSVKIELKDSIESYKLSLEMQKNEHQQHQSEVLKLTQQLDESSQKLTKLQSQYLEKTLILEQSIAEVSLQKSRYQELEDTLTSVKTENLDMKNKLESQINQLVSERDSLKTETENRHAELLEMQGLNSDLQKHSESLSSQIVNLQKTIADLNNKEVTMTTELNKLRTSLAEAEAKVHHFETVVVVKYEKTIEEYKVVIEEKCSVITEITRSYKSTLETQENEKQQLQLEVVKFKQELEESLQKFTELQNNYLETTSKLEQSIAEVTQINILTSERNSLKVDIQELHEQLLGVKENNSDLQEKMDLDKVERENLSSKLSDLQKELQEKIQEHATRKLEWDAEMANMNKRLEIIEKERADLERIYKEYVEKTDTKVSEIKLEHEHAIEKSQNEIKNLKQALKESNAKISDLENKKLELAEKCSTSISEIEKMRAENEQLNLHIHSLSEDNKRIEVIENEKEDLERIYKEYVKNTDCNISEIKLEHDRAMEKSQNEITNLLESLEESKKMISDLENSKEDLSNQLSVSISESEILVAKLRAENEQLNERISSLSEDNKRIEILEKERENIERIYKEHVENTDYKISEMKEKSQKEITNLLQTLEESKKMISDLENSKEDLSNHLSVSISESEKLVAKMQVENEQLNDRISSLSEDNKRIEVIDKEREDLERIYKEYLENTNCKISEIKLEHDRAIEKSQTEITKLLNELEESKEMISELEKSKEDVENKLSAAMSENEKIVAKIRAENEQLSERITSLLENNKRVEVVEKERENLERIYKEHVEDTNHKISEIKLEYDREIEKLQTEISNLNETLEESKKKITDLENAKEDFANKLSISISNSEKLAEKNQAENEQLKEINDRLSEDNKRIEVVEKEREDLERMYKEYVENTERKISQIKLEYDSAIEKSQTKITHLNQALEESKNKITDLENIKEDFTNKLSASTLDREKLFEKLRVENEDLNERITSLSEDNKRIEIIEKERDDIKRIYNEYVENADRKISEIKLEHDLSLEKNQIELVHLNQALEESKKMISDLENSKEDIANQLKTSISESETLMEKMRVENEHLNEHINSLSEEKKDLVIKLKQINNDLSELKSSKEESNMECKAKLNEIEDMKTKLEYIFNLVSNFSEVLEQELNDNRHKLINAEDELNSIKEKFVLDITTNLNLCSKEKHEINNLNKQICDVILLKNKLEMELQSMKDKIVEMEDSKQMNYKDFETKVEELKNQHEIQLKNLNTHNEEIIQELEKKHKENEDKLNKKNLELSTDLEDLKQNDQTDLATKLQELRNQHEIQLKNLETHNDELIQALETKLKEKDKIFNEKISEISILNSQLVDSLTKAEKMEAEKNNLLSNLEIVNMELSNSTKRIHELESENKNLSLSHGDLLEKHRILSDIQEDMVKLRSAYANLMKENSHLHQDFAASKKTIEDRNLQLLELTRIKEAYQKLLEDNNKVNMELDTLRYKRTRDKEEFKRLLEEERSKSNTNCDSQLQEVRNEYEDKLKKMKDKIVKLYREEVDKERRKVTTKQQEHDQAEETINSLKSQLWMTSNKYVDIKRENEKLREQLRTSSTHGPSFDVLDTVRDDFRGSRESVSSLRERRVVPRELEDRRTVTLPRDMRLPVPQVDINPPVPSNLEHGLRMEDEEGEMFNNTYLADLRAGRCVEPSSGRESVASSRFSELQYRNSLCLPHLKSSYPAETQFASPTQFKEEDIKRGVDLDDSMSSSLLPGEKPRTKKDWGQTLYKKPGPPTPSKNGGRLSLQGNEVHPHPRDVLREHNSIRGPEKGRLSSTPSRIKALFTRSNASSSHRADTENQSTPPRGKRRSIFRR